MTTLDTTARPEGGSDDRAEVFVSYSTPDEARAREVCEALTSSGLRCWFAPRSIEGGTDWAAEITDAIQRSQVLVLLYSSAADKSVHVRRELHLAAEHGLRVIPVRLEDVKPDGSLAYFLAGIHWIDLFRKPDAIDLSSIVRNALAEQGGVLLPAPPPPAWRLALEMLSALLLTLLASHMLLGEHGGKPLLRSNWKGAILLLGTLQALAVYVVMRARCRKRPGHPLNRALLLYTLALVAFGGALHHYRTVAVAWVPERSTVEVLLSLEPGEPIGEDQLTQVEGPLHLERQGEGFFALVFVPPLDWLSPKTRKKMDLRAKRDDLPPVQACLANEGAYFLQWMEGETSARNLSVLLFLSLYLIALAAFSAGHACVLTLVERLGSKSTILK